MELSKQRLFEKADSDSWEQQQTKKMKKKKGNVVKQMLMVAGRRCPLFVCLFHETHPFPLTYVSTRERIKIIQYAKTSKMLFQHTKQ